MRSKPCNTKSVHERAGGVVGRLRHGRRGVALLLVTIALGVAGAATTFYLASRDNSGAIGANAELGVSSQWAAQSGAEIAVAIMQTDKNWIAAATSGTLLNGVALSGANVSVVVTNLSGKPPTATDRELIVTAMASVNGVSSVTQRIVSVRPSATVQEAIDGELGEYGIYATQSLEVDAGSAVGVWPASPEYLTGQVVKIGAGFTAASNAIIDAGAILNGAKLFVESAATAGLEGVESCGKFVGGDKLPLAVPAVQAVTPSALSSLGSVGGNQTVSGVPASRTIAPGKYGHLMVDNGAVVTLDGTVGPNYSFNQLSVSNESVLLIKGNVNILVRNDMGIDTGGAIELADASSSVVFYLQHDLLISDATVGFNRALARDYGRTRADITAYANPSRVRILGVVSGRRFILDAHALACMRIHAPQTQVDIIQGSTIFGRATASRIRLIDQAAIMYDPALDNRVGFTETDGPLYNSDGTPIAGLVSAITSFNPALGCQSLSSTLSSAVTVVEDLVGGLLGGLGGLLGGGGGGGGGGGVVVAVEATPRSAARAVAKPWPVRARALERYNPGAGGGGDVFAGSIVRPDLATVIFDPRQASEASTMSAGDVTKLVTVIE